MKKKTLEEILYDLDLSTGDPTFEYTIAKVCQKLPDKVCEWVKENCYFLLAQDSMMIPLDEENCIKDGSKNILVRGEKLILILPKHKRSQSTIAHEIAHGYLKHGNNANFAHPRKSKKDAVWMEREANRLIIKWGFKPANQCV